MSLDVQPLEHLLSARDVDGAGPGRKVRALEAVRHDVAFHWGLGHTTPMRRLSGRFRRIPSLLPVLIRRSVQPHSSRLSSRLLCDN